MQPPRLKQTRTLKAQVESLEAARCNGRRTSARDHADAAEPAAGQRARRQGRAWQSRGKSLGRTAEVRLPCQASLGAGRSPRHPGLQSRRQDLRLALRRPLRSGSASRTCPRQLHARPPHPRARLHRGPAALHGQLEVALRHRAASQSSPKTSSTATTKEPTSPESFRTAITGSSPPPRFPSRTSFATRRSTRPSFLSPSAPTRRASAPRPDPTARMSAA